MGSESTPPDPLPDPLPLATSPSCFSFRACFFRAFFSQRFFRFASAAAASSAGAVSSGATVDVSGSTAATSRRPPTSSRAIQASCSTPGSKTGAVAIFEALACVFASAFCFVSAACVSSATRFISASADFAAAFAAVASSCSRSFAAFAAEAAAAAVSKDLTRAALASAVALAASAAPFVTARSSFVRRKPSTYCSRYPASIARRAWTCSICSTHKDSASAVSPFLTSSLE